MVNNDVDSKERIIVREKVISERNDPLPAQDIFLDKTGLNNQSAKTGGIFLSNLTKEIEVIYMNTVPTHLG